MMAVALGCGLIDWVREKKQATWKQIVLQVYALFAACALMGALCFALGTIIGIVGGHYYWGNNSIFTQANQVDDLGHHWT